MKHRLLGLVIFLTPLVAWPNVKGLPALSIKSGETSISGLSSGGALAVQYGVAHSSKVKGIAVIAGIPYYCAQDSIFTALTTCMKGEPNVDDLIHFTQQVKSKQLIDDTKHLNSKRIWLFSGTKDDTVKPIVMDATKDYFAAYTTGKNIRYVNEVPSGHAFVTDNYGSDCESTQAPFINDCDYDSAKQLLTWIYGSLKPKTTVKSRGLIEFEQTPYIAQGSCMADSGFVYVPENCASGGCRLHIALHGCKQNIGKIGSTFASKAGFNAWAESNDIVVLYPQTKKRWFNPTACWDWWGYTDSNYAYKTGKQIQAIYNMTQALSVSP